MVFENIILASTSDDQSSLESSPPQIKEVKDEILRKAEISLQQSRLNVHSQPSFNVSSESLGRYSFVGSTTTDDRITRPWRERVGAVWEENKGVVLMILAQFFGSAMAAIARLMEIQTDDRPPLNPFQILFARQSITVVMSLAYMWWAKVPDAPLGPWKVRPLLAARGFAGFFGVTGLYFSLLYLPLSDAIVMTFLAPMMAAWICSIMIKTPFTRTQKLAGIVAILGVLLITQPFNFVTSLVIQPEPGSNSSISNVHHNATAAIDSLRSISEPTPAQRAFAVACGIVGVCGAASVYVIISSIGKRAHPLISVTYFSGWCTFVSIIAMLFIPSVGFRMPATLHEWSLLTCLGVTGFVMQFLMTASLAHKKSNRVLNMVYSQMLFALGFDKWLFNETPTLLSWLGSGLILGSVVWTAIKKDSEKKGDQPEEVARGSTSNADEEAGLVAGMEAQVDDELPSEDSPSHPAMEMQSLRS